MSTHYVCCARNAVLPPASSSHTDMAGSGVENLLLERLLSWLCVLTLICDQCFAGFNIELYTTQNVSGARTLAIGGTADQPIVYASSNGANVVSHRSDAVSSCRLQASQAHSQNLLPEAVIKGRMLHEPSFEIHMSNPHAWLGTGLSNSRQEPVWQPNCLSSHQRSQQSWGARLLQWLIIYWSGGSMTKSALCSVSIPQLSSLEWVLAVQVLLLPFLTWILAATLSESIVWWVCFCRSQTLQGMTTLTTWSWTRIARYGPPSPMLPFSHWSCHFTGCSILNVTASVKWRLLLIASWLFQVCTANCCKF